MNTGVKVLLASLLGIAGSVIGGYYFLRNKSVDLLQPAGSIGVQEKDLIVTASVMMAFVILIVWGLCIWIAFKYRSGNKKASYMPEWDKNAWLETVWWAYR